MTDESKEIAPGIAVGSKKGFGQPVVKGTGVGVAAVLAELARTLDPSRTAQKLGIATEGLLAALDYAAEILAEEPASRLNERRELAPGVIADGRIRFGKPVLEGTRIDVALVVQQLALGESLAGVLENYPSLTPERIAAALGYARDVIARERVSAV